MLLSDCCSAPIVGEVEGTGEDACGRCSRCGEMMGVWDDEKEADDAGDDE